MVLPDSVLAYRFLHSASLKEDEVKLCRITIFDDEMRYKVLSLFGDKVQTIVCLKIDGAIYRFRSHSYYFRSIYPILSRMKDTMHKQLLREDHTKNLKLRWQKLQKKF